MMHLDVFSTGLYQFFFFQQMQFLAYLWHTRCIYVLLGEFDLETN